MTGALMLLAFAAVFVTNERDGSISVIDADAGTTISTIRIGDRPRGLQFSPDRRTVYVAVSDQLRRKQNDVDRIAIVDAATHAVKAKLPSGLDPEQLALSPDGRSMYVANEDAGTMSQLDVRTGRVRGSGVVGIEPEGVAASPDGRWVYVTAESSNSVAIFDTSAGRVPKLAARSSRSTLRSTPSRDVCNCLQAPAPSGWRSGPIGCTLPTDGQTTSRS